MAASACRKATTLLLDSGGTRPHLPPTTWPPLTKQLKPWLAAGSSPGVSRNLKLQLRNPPSPAQLQALGACLPCLRSLQFQHTHSGVYSRHLMSVAALTQLQELALLMEMPKLELRSLAHQRLRRVPLKADCLSSLVSLSRLEISCTAHTGACACVHVCLCALADDSMHIPARACGTHTHTLYTKPAGLLFSRLRQCTRRRSLQQDVTRGTAVLS